MGIRTKRYSPPSSRLRIFFLLYTSVKWVQISMLLDTTTLQQAILLIWQMEDQAIFAGIISFYFGQRAMSKVRSGK